MGSLSKHEQEYRMTLPQVYKNFYDRCGANVLSNLVGTDLSNGNPELKMWAVELLQENGTDNFLHEKDFVFMIHQGYMFWFFRADGNPNPDVFGYSEVDKEIKNLGNLEDFLRQYK